jgi:branched-chain amino acid transport system permease protein
MTKERVLLRGLAALALLGLALFPLIGGTFYIQLCTKIMILAIFAMSLDLLIGFTGLVSLGHAAFFGIAAYTLVLLSRQYEAANFWTSLPAALAAAALASFLIGVLVLRTSGVYFIMATLAFAQMLYAFFADSGVAGGHDGVYIYAKPDAAIFGWHPFDLERTAHFYYVALVFMVLVFVGLRMVLGSLFGHVVRGIKANEQRMRSLGFPVFRYKLASFVLAGTIAGLAGYLAAAQFGFVNPELLGWRNSGDALMMVILGGMGTLFGPVLGAFALVLVQEIFADLTKHWLLPMGGFVILAVLALPRGLGGALERFGKPRAKAAPHE